MAMTGGSVFGSSSRKMMRRSGVPSARARHERFLAQGQHLGAHDAGDLRPRRHAEEDDDTAEPAAEDDGHEQDEEERRDDEQAVGDPHDDVVDPASVEAREKPEHDADRRGRRRHCCSHQERGVDAVEQPAEDVPAEIVGAHGMALRGRGEHVRGQRPRIAREERGRGGHYHRDRRQHGQGTTA